MIDHVNLPVRDLERSAVLYRAALSAFGWAFEHRDGDAVGFGAEGWTLGIFAAGEPFPPLHPALSAPNRAAVDRFHAQAIEAGGRDNGAPGLRPACGALYCAAFVLDPDGHNIEAV